jgi:hypothetical protein
MNAATEFSTDFRALAVFDNAELPHRVRDRAGWWREDDLRDVPEVMEGVIALLPIGREGTYRAQLRVAEAPSDAEQPWAVAAVEGLGLRVTSGEAFVGAPERLPGDGAGQRLSHIPGTGAIVEVPPGDYAVTVHILHWREEDAHYDDDGEVRPEAPPDFLVLLQPRDPEAALALAEPLPKLLDLLPKKEAKARAKVVNPPRRQRSSEPTRRRRRGEPAPVSVATEPKPPPSVPEEVAPLTSERVRAACREVLYGALLHPLPPPPLSAIHFKPPAAGLLAHDIEFPKVLDKLTKVREQLRMLEAKVNANDALSFWERAELEAPITEVYQSVESLVAFLAQRWDRGR